MGFLGILGIVIVLYILVSMRVLRQYERGVVFLLGKFTGVRSPGLSFIFLPLQQMTRVSLRTVTMLIPSQKIITKDNVSIDIAADCDRKRPRCDQPDQPNDGAQCRWPLQPRSTTV